MNDLLRQLAQRSEPLELCVPEAALTRLELRLARDRASGEVWDASVTHLVPPDALGELVDYWCDEFDFRAAEARLNALPLHVTSASASPLVYAHLPSRRPDAIPLLLLHSGFGSPAELAGLFGRLSDPGAHGARPSEAFHVVCPALPGFGLSHWPDASLPGIAEACARLMASLGYRRYVAHGCELGAAVARQLAVGDARHLAGALLGDCPAFPDAEPLGLAELTPHEKSQLALLTELQLGAPHRTPDTPITWLAAALAQLGDSLDEATLARVRDPLLFGLTLSSLGGDAALQTRLLRASALAGPSSQTPLGVCAFPLDRPSLRRFAENQHRIVSFTEQERGGCLPALEQPELLLAELVRFFAPFR